MTSASASTAERVHVLLNGAAGTLAGMADADARVRDAFARAGLPDIDLDLVDAAGMDAALKAACAIERGVLVVGGGDGTISGAAAALAGTECTLGVLPLGTFNHFAKDLGIPIDLPGAAAVIAAGHRRRIDLAEANGRIFVNHAAIGLYVETILERNRLVAERGIAKRIATVRAFIAGYRRFRRFSLRLRVGAETLLRRTALVFAANNRYVIEAYGLAGRALPGRELLSLFVTRQQTKRAFAWMILRAIFARTEPGRDYDMLEVTEATVETRRRRIRIALDGEVTRMRTPIRFAIRRGALSVLAPPP